MKPSSSKVGNSATKNVMAGVGCALVTDSGEMRRYHEPLMRGSLVYNTTTGQLSVADGITELSALPDHKHPGLAPIAHSHLVSANEVWRISEPRLWYTDDLHNHPELIPLDGREIPNDQAEYISRVYPGSTLLTHPCKSMDEHGFQNDTMSLSVSEFQGDFHGGRVSNDEINPSNMLSYTDQWLTNSSDVDKAQSITIKFKHGNTYAPNEYWMIPAAGIASAPLRTRPTPKSWKLEGSKDDGGSWDLIDERTDIGPETWQPLTIQTFKIENISDAYSTVRLTITAWNNIVGDPLETGLRRFWLFGNKTGVFTMPKLDSPSDSFTWVIPYKDLDVGLIHEAIGDVGMTASLPEHLPGYRVSANGQSLPRAAYETLFQYTGFTQDHDVTITSLTAPTGSILDDTKWEEEIKDTHAAKYFDIIPKMGPDECLGAYSLIQSTGCYPLAWVLEGAGADDTFEEIQTIASATIEDLKTNNFKFYLPITTKDKHYTKFRVTITEWSSDKETATIEVKLFAHKENEFYVPNLTIQGSETCYPYIVANNTARDVSAEVIAQLQKNQAELLRVVSKLQAHVNELDPQFNLEPPKGKKE